MNTISVNVAIAIIIIFGSLPTHLKQFPKFKEYGCAPINDTVPKPKLDGQLWRVTQWMKNRRRQRFRCFKDDFPSDNSLATRQNVFLATDNANYAIHLLCLGGDSSEEIDDQHYYLVHTLANTRNPSAEIMKQIQEAHVRHGLNLKWLNTCK